MKKKGFTLIELLVVIAIIAMLLAILMPALSKVKKIAQRVVCGTNLKGLGTAQTVYANDYEDRYVQQVYISSGTTSVPISDRTGEWQNPARVHTVANQNLSVGASLYLLVREADVSPKSFVCPSSAETVYDGTNPANLDITELWDFGHPNMLAGPVRCQSYAYHNPYNRFSADGSRGAAFAIMADKNPYHDQKLTYGAVTAQNLLDTSYEMPNDWGGAVVQKWQIMAANAQPHGRDGQNVVFGDGHSAFEKRPDVGVQHDNIYTPYAIANPTGPIQIRRGLCPPIGGMPFVQTNNPMGQSDSFLINDSRRP
jgi:prepilin-type N-terminal cleavage/methylation domain-containing protein